MELGGRGSRLPRPGHLRRLVREEVLLEIVVTRNASNQGATLGRLQCGAFECWTLEDQVREVPGQPVASWKVQNGTAMPRGRYRVIITYSPHFGCDLPELLNVPGFTKCRVHWGNKAADTDGCILVGLTTEGNLVLGSKKAFGKLFPIIKAALAAGDDVYIAIL